ncbi:MAG TPA: hypothetical protein VK821_15490 [Dehalococcoidia bacterium]|jgi:hypothetical protein|nr:hypothetical protein [Dehalococcoidia bacterium]
MNHVTIATSSGIVWLTLVTHFGAALLALAAGTIALAVAKGGRLHKQSGIVFTWAMITTGILAAVLSAYEGKSVVGAIFACYLVFTAMTTVKPLPRAGRRIDVALMIFAIATAALLLVQGVVVWQKPHHMFAGVPAGMIFFLGTVCLFAAIGDLRMILEGGLRGTRRLARHLWRMCFGLFIATGSFFIGQMKFIPAPIRVVPLLFVLGIAPLVILLYWMWRVRLQRRVSGIILAREIPAAG